MRTRRVHRLFVLLVFISFLAAIPGRLRADPILFQDFSSTTGLNLVGNAGQSGNKLRLTPSAPGQAGAAWFATKQFVEDGFKTTFDFQITNLVNTGSDGFAFVIQNSSATALGPGGGDMGYGGITNSLAVEFDTHQNLFESTVTPHVSVQTGGTLPNSPAGSFSLGATSAIPNIKDGAVHTATIDYAPGTMKIFLDGALNPVLTVSVNLGSILTLDNGSAYVGFTAGTGGGYENHDINSWVYGSVPTPDSLFLLSVGLGVLVRAFKAGNGSKAG